MANVVRHKRGTSTPSASDFSNTGELLVDTNTGNVFNKTDGSSVVKVNGLGNVVEDTTPQLGGSLDVNGQDIVTTSNADIELAPNGTGKTVLKGNSNPGTLVFNCESNSHGQTVKSQPHSASVTNVLTLPAGGDQEIVGTVATQTLTSKTLTSPVLNTGVSGSAILDEDNMASNSATQLATQQSIKAYVDANAGGGGNTDIGKVGKTTADRPLYSDATLTILSNKNNPIVEVRYSDMFPVSLSGLDYNSQEADVDYLTATIDFRYKLYEIVTL